MAKTTSDFLIERLQAWGVNRVYGYPGDGINGIMGALERADGAIDFVQVRHEEMDRVTPSIFDGDWRRRRHRVSEVAGCRRAMRCWRHATDGKVECQHPIKFGSG
jgi:hypothetical protein